MNSIQLLREQLTSAHETMEGTVADVTPDSAQFSTIGQALPIGAAYAHAVLAEDMIVSQMLANKPMLSAGRTDLGVSEPMPSQAEWSKHEQWYKTVNVDLPKLREFAKNVYKASDDYLASLKEEDLDFTMEVPGMGKCTRAYVINNFVILHIANLTGEISSVKGMQGLKGYPF